MRRYELTEEVVTQVSRLLPRGLRPVIKALVLFCTGTVVAGMRITPTALEIWLVACYPARLEPCPFCNIDQSRIRLENEYAIAFFYAHPVNDGHILVVPRQHASTIHDLEIAEQEIRPRIEREVLPRTTA